MATEAAATAAMRGKVGTETTSNAGQRHLVRVIGTPVTFRTPPGIPLLHGMIAAGASAVPVGCRGGGCGICRIHVLSGPYHSLPIDRNRISETDEATGILLSCRLTPQGDLAIKALSPTLWGSGELNGIDRRPGKKE